MEFVQERKAYFEKQMLGGDTSGNNMLPSSSCCNFSPNINHDVGQRASEPAPSGSGGVETEREHLFDKVVTPSDVGKLNRLVIPKQNAEKYFPLDSSTNKRGLLLNFEDRNGKPWRFRYSYWTSSQSYVMTKGWSRFVKEKKLYAGDIVSFERGIGETGNDLFYIDWRRRPHAPSPLTAAILPHQFISLPTNSFTMGRFLFMPPPPLTHCISHVQQLNYHYSGGNNDGDFHHNHVLDSVPVVHGKAEAKRLRLFGVNLECPIPEVPECDIISSTIMPPPPLQLRLFNHITPLPTLQTSSCQLPLQGKPSFSFDFDSS